MIVVPRKCLLCRSRLRAARRTSGRHGARKPCSNKTGNNSHQPDRPIGQTFTRPALAASASRFVSGMVQRRGGNKHCGLLEKIRKASGGFDKSYQRMQTTAIKPQTTRHTPGHTPRHKPRHKTAPHITHYSTPHTQSHTTLHTTPHT